jgi:hypothetical protein
VASRMMSVMPRAEPTSTPPTSSPSTKVELWLADLNDLETSPSVYWQANHRVQSADWVTTRSVEQLSVLLSTRTKAHNNACQVYGARHDSARSTSVIGLQPQRGPDGGFAVVLSEKETRSLGDIRRISYRYNNYQGFSAISAAEICWAWVTAGTIPPGLTYRKQ